MENNLNEKREGGFAIGLILVIAIIACVYAVMIGFKNGCHCYSEMEEHTVVTTTTPEADVPKQPTGQTVYTVEAGDTIWDIVMEYCNGEFSLFYEMNPNSDKLKFIVPGDTFIIPTWE